MNRIFSVEDRQKAFEYILTVTKEHEKIVALCQVGSGAIGYHDARSDLDFVIAMDTGDSMAEVMEYMKKRITEKYKVIYFKQAEDRHLQVYVLDNLLEIDIGFGGYEHAAAWKPAFKVLFDRSGVVEEKMIQSRAWMDDSIYGGKQKKDIEQAFDSVWMRMMHAAVAINRGLYFRAIGELEYIRKTYIDLLGDRFRVESGLNREIDQLPEQEKDLIRSTFVQGETKEALWNSLLTLTALVYRELEGNTVPIPKDMVLAYYEDLK